MPIYKQTTEITNIDDLLSSVERDIEEVYFGDKNVFTVWGEYDDTLPAQYSANGDYLADYRIYGSAGGVGDRTVNLCTQLIAGTYESTGYETTYAYMACTTQPILFDEGEITISVSQGQIYLKKIENGVWVQTIVAAAASPATITIPSPGTYAIQINAAMTNQILKEINDTIVVVEGSTAPTSYIPYGYEVDMRVRSANIFDGEITQGAYSTADGSAIPSNRYIKSSKIHLDVSGYITLSFNCPKEGTGGTAVDGFVYFWNGSSYIGYYQATAKEMQTAQIPDGATDFAFAVGAGYGNVIETSDISKIMLNYGSSPLSYQPYSNTTTLIYIGSDPLGEDEYVDYGEQKIYRRTEQVMPSAPAETKTSNGITITCDGEGRYSISGTATATTSILFDIPEFTIPVSVGGGGNGTFSLFNTIYYPTQVRVSIRFWNGTTLVDTWNMNVENRTNTTYTAMGGKTVNKMDFYIVSDTEITNGQVSPMFTNNGVLPSNYIPYLQPADPPVPLPALPTVDGTNIVDYAGQSAAVPSRFYAKYRKEGF